MANEEHLRIIKRGVKAWNQWRKENPDIQPDLSGADLSEAYLSGAYLSVGEKPALLFCMALVYNSVGN
jgi:hypothetical protein